MAGADENRYFRARRRQSYSYPLSRTCCDPHRAYFCTYTDTQGASSLCFRTARQTTIERETRLPSRKGKMLPVLMRNTPLSIY